MHGEDEHHDDVELDDMRLINNENGASANSTASKGNASLERQSHKITILSQLILVILVIVLVALMATLQSDFAAYARDASNAKGNSNSTASSPSTPPSPSASPSTSPSHSPSPSSTPLPSDPIAKITAGMKKIQTLFTVYDKPFPASAGISGDRFYMEIKKSQLERLFVVDATVTKGEPQNAMYHFPINFGNPYWFMWRQVDTRIELVQPDFRFRINSTQDSAYNAYVAGAKQERLVYVFPVVASYKHNPAAPAPGRTEDVVLIDATAYLRLGLFLDGSAARLSNNPLYDFVTNVTGTDSMEVELELPFQYSRLVIHYSVVMLEEQPRMLGRVVDERVGFFSESFLDMGEVRPENREVNYANRWYVTSTEPLRYYVDPTVPVEYRDAFKQGIEAWNKAFAAAGLGNNAIKAVLPGDADWPADYNPGMLKYSVLSWTEAQAATFGFGASMTDPRNARLLNADIIITNGWSRVYQSQYDQRVRNMLVPRSMQGSMRSSTASPSASYASPASSSFSFDAATAEMEHPLIKSVHEKLQAIEGADAAQWSIWDLLSQDPQRRAAVDVKSAHRLLNAMRLRTALLANNVANPGQPLPIEYIRAGLRDVVMHEVGHTLGLRHNFKGSTAVTPAQLHDVAYTQANGLTASVMDYLPTNIARNSSAQGEFFTSTPGAYDIFCIRYGYTPLSDEVQGVQHPTLKAMAQANLQPFDTDEDVAGAEGWDPYANYFDLSSDPLWFYRERIETVKATWPLLLNRTVEAGENFEDLGAAGLTLMIDVTLSGYYATKYVGGQVVSKAHRGDAQLPNNKPPITPVSVAKQREALALIAEVLSSDDIVPHSDVFRYMMQRTGMLGLVSVNIHQAVTSLRGAVVAQLFQATRMERLRDDAWMQKQQYGANTDVVTVREVFDTVHNAVFANMTASNSFQRDTQTMWVQFMLFQWTFAHPAMQSEITATLESLYTEVQTALSQNITNTEVRDHLVNLRHRLRMWSQTGAGSPQPVFTFICTELHAQGLLSSDVYRLDGQFGQRIQRERPLAYMGYALWAPTWVKLMKSSALVTQFTALLALPWAKQMAYEMGVGDGSWFGWFIMHAGMRVCELLAVVTGWMGF